MARLPGLVGGCVAAALLFFSWPLAVTAFKLGPGDVAAELSWSSVLLSEAGMSRLLASRRAVLADGYHADAHADIAVLLTNIVVAELNGNAPVAQVLDRARTHARSALRGDPASSRTWHVLATVDALSGDMTSAASALAMSYRADPYFPAMSVGRVRKAISLWSDLPSEVQERVRAEMKEAFRKDRELVVRLALSAGRIDDLRSSLAGDQGDLRRLETMLRAMEEEISG